MGGYIANKWGLGKWRAGKVTLFKKPQALIYLLYSVSLTHSQPPIGFHGVAWMQTCCSECLGRCTGGCIAHAYLGPAASWGFASHRLKQEGGGDVRGRESKRQREYGEIIC